MVRKGARRRYQGPRDARTAVTGHARPHAHTAPSVAHTHALPHTADSPVRCGLCAEVPAASARSDWPEGAPPPPRARPGSVDAQLTLAHLNFHGARGLQPDLGRAFEFYSKAAAAGEATAFSHLGNMCPPVPRRASRPCVPRRSPLAFVPSCPLRSCGPRVGGCQRSEAWVEAWVGSCGAGDGSA